MLSSVELPHGGARLPAGGPSQPWYDAAALSVMSSNTALVGTKSVADGGVPFAYAELTCLDALRVGDVPPVRVGQRRALAQRQHAEDVGRRDQGAP